LKGQASFAFFGGITTGCARTANGEDEVPAISLGFKTQPPGTEFWDPETGRQKSQLKRLETCRD
jgi:hypothetical protein